MIRGFDRASQQTAERTLGSWQVYIARCADGTLYTGIARDADRRIAEHNAGKGAAANYTRARRPVVLVYTEPAENRSEASRREYRIKQLSRAEKLALVLASGVRAAGAQRE
ncbi:MAG: GIY-YIG nuclease family protein [Burkholderiales bacterium]|nr:GIY-YIG nuclease family protein [Burkholderiales bacterium]